MPGICPNCVQLVQDGDQCPQCKGPLISVSHWSENRQQFLTGSGDESSPVEDPNQIKLPFTPSVSSSPTQDEFDTDTFFYRGAQADAQVDNSSQAPPVRFFALKFLLGAGSGAAAFVSLLYLVYSIQGG